MFTSSYIVLITTVLATATNDSSEWLDKEIEYYHRMKNFRHGEPHPCGVQGPKMKEKEREYYLQHPVNRKPSIYLQNPEDPPKCQYGNFLDNECMTCHCTEELVWTCDIYCLHEITERLSRYCDY